MSKIFIIITLFCFCIFYNSYSQNLDQQIFEEYIQDLNKVGLVDLHLNKIYQKLMQKSRVNKYEWLLDSMKTFEFQDEDDSVLTHDHKIYYDMQGKPIKFEEIFNHIIPNNYSAKYVREVFPDHKIITNYRKEENNNNWQQVSQRIEELNDDGEVIKSSSKTWIEDETKWQNKSKTEYFYEAGNLIAQNFFTWNIDDNDWNQVIKTTFDYNEFGNEILELQEKWNEAINNWEFTIKRETYYNEQNNPILTSSYSYSSGQWINYNKIETIYDENGQGFELINNVYSFTSSSWYIQLKLLITYNNFSQIKSSETLVHDPTKNKLLKEAKSFYFYENNYLSKIIKNGWDLNIEQYKLNSKTYYYRRYAITNLNDLELIDINIYPNPSSSYLQINIPEMSDWVDGVISIYNLNGKLLLQSDTFNSRIDIRSITPGVFMYRLTNKNKVIKQGKFIKQ